MKTITIADQMIGLYAEYVEGFIDSSMVKYNNQIKLISNEDIVEMIEKTPFERHAVQLANILVDKGVFMSVMTEDAIQALEMAHQHLKDEADLNAFEAQYC